MALTPLLYLHNVEKKAHGCDRKHMSGKLTELSSKDLYQINKTKIEHMIRISLYLMFTAMKFI